MNSGDVETAFLASEMDCEVWVKMPPFWGSINEPITQGSRLFYETFSAELQQMGYRPAKADKCLFLNPSTSEHVAVVIWVDDFIYMCEKEETWNKFLARLRQRFTIPNAGSLRSFLGMEISYDPDARCMHVSSPLPCQAGTVFSKKDCPATPSMRSTEYASLIALANFLACWTRPDIAFTVNKLCKFMANPGDVHWQALEYLLRYLRGTRSLGLSFKFGNSTVKGVHADASYADCPSSV